MHRTMAAAVVAMAMAAPAAFAQTQQNGSFSPGTIQNQNVNNPSATIQKGAIANENRNYNTNVNSQHQSQKQTQHQGQLQGQGQFQDASNQGVSQTTTFEDRRQAPGIGIPSPASGPCTGFSGGVGLSVAGFGGGFSAAVVDRQCEIREAARIADALGQKELALKLLRNLDVVKELEAPRTAEIAPARAVDVSEVSSYCQKNPADYYCRQN